MMVNSIYFETSNLNGTVVNLFKKKTGMTPYEFKKAQDTLRN